MKVSYLVTQLLAKPIEFGIWLVVLLRSDTLEEVHDVKFDKNQWFPRKR
jgi:hypothetical protein